jgi:dinuclear metal center YbgI/SA1388 family protein
MSVQIKELIAAFEEVAPSVWQESYDNSGLIVGSYHDTVCKALLSLDCTEAVIEEAVKEGCDMVICHHPIVFKGLKRLNGANYVERTVMKAIQHKVAIYAVHTNLDNVLQGGVNAKIAEKLGLKDGKILDPKKGILNKIVIYVPEGHVLEVQEAAFQAGAGAIGHYQECGFSVTGRGTFKPVEGANPHTGTAGMRHEAQEIRWEVLVSEAITNRVLHAMMSKHPYEEVAYEIIPLKNEHLAVGSGLWGRLPEPMPVTDFLDFIKERLAVPQLKFTPLHVDREIKTVAVCGGSGSFLIPKARQTVDAYITADVKYHEFFDAEGTLLLCDIGHYESEKYTLEIFKEILWKKFPNFANIFAQINTNPVQYR